ncbi:dienelactone hydrolase family protein [Rhodotorula toruloides]|uniref:Dienelactone hydrolase family protein n=1 Tax=Rhodotorula toruloides TaxID=5286 RepID=A0A511KLI2_RHOTO|nr:dienelactone hydrolase family protein [Rhodotorula toruloides]
MPVGTFEDINGIKTYVSHPQGDYDKTKAFLIIAARQARSGLTHLRKQHLRRRLTKRQPHRRRLRFQGPRHSPHAGLPPRRSHPWHYLTLPAEEKQKRLGECLARHGKDVTAPAVDKVIEGLKQRNVKEFAAIGYCFGARYVVDLCISSPPVSPAGAVAQPSLFSIPDDLHALNVAYKQDFAKKITKNNEKHVHAGPPLLSSPALFASASTRSKLRCRHESTIRCNADDPQKRKAADDAFDKTVAWLKERFMSK